MEDRYEIRGKIGQGGIGSVHRGFDHRMNREVAIKRILTSAEDETLEQEATKQLIQEAGALASLQHPHIVTIFDVGADEDGPYVVMELINGKTLDEIIEVAPMTFEDFRELAMQTQEALIAAQELDLIHSDLKPPNIMLSWLPSGKFQVKIVDFGLAVLAQSQSKEELESLEAVFGSIFFMPPEQFERSPLDSRSDLYSIGCVYYQALTGKYPFNGESGTEVMTAHLHHTVRPIRELRADIPIWLCEWVMWLINRYPEDRPESAREALSVFLQNDKKPNPEMSQGGAQTMRPKLIIPGSIPSADGSPATATSSTPTSSADSSTQAVSISREGPHSTAAQSARAQQPKKDTTSPQALGPPTGSKPSVHTTAKHVMATPTAAPTSGPATSPAPTAGAPTGGAATQEPDQATGQVELTAHVPGMDEKRGISKGVLVMISVVLVILIAVGGVVLKSRMEKNKRNEIYNRLIAKGTAQGASEVPMTADELMILLDVASTIGEVEDREGIYQTLKLGKGSDGTNVDATIAQYATTMDMMPVVREKLIADVLKERNNTEVVPVLIGYAKNTDNSDGIVAAFKAIKDMVNDQHADVFLKFVATAPDASVRSAAEKNLSHIIKSSTNRTYLTRRVTTEYANAKNRDSRHAMIRLLGQCSTSQALTTVKDVLNGNDMADQIAAIIALGSWDDATAIPVLMDFLKETNDERTRGKAMNSLIQLLKKIREEKPNWSDAQANWKAFSELATTGPEKQLTIRALANLVDPWAITLLTSFTKDGNPSVAKLATDAIQHVRDQQALQKKNK